MRILDVGYDRRISEVSYVFVRNAYAATVLTLVFGGVTFLSFVVIIILVAALRVMDRVSPRVVFMNNKYRMTAKVLTPHWPDKMTPIEGDIPSLKEYLKEQEAFSESEQ